jgi:small-conductance mechanosensitive channel
MELSGLLSSPWVQGPIGFVLWMSLLLFLRRVLLRSLRRVAARTHWTWDDVIIQALSGPLLIAIFASGLLILGRILPLSPEWDRAFDVLLAAAIPLALVLSIDRLTRGALERAASRSPVLVGARGLILGAVRGLIISIGILIFLDSIGISITPLLASLGVGSLAVALALQETLANLFAGLHIVVDRPLEPGHYVRLEGGEEGFVARVGWRSTWIRTRPGNVVIVPNSKLASSVILNTSLPTPDQAFLVQVGVDYGSDLEHVERVTLEVGREVMTQVSGGVPGFEPLVRFHTFADSSINFTVVLRAVNFDSHNLVMHEFIKRLHARFRKEGIVIPFPIRTLNFAPGTGEEIGRRLRGRPSA